MVSGSSPLTRGKRGHEPPRRRRPGLIPAHAGKTGVIPANTVPDWAHPRSRGENRHWVGSRTRREGSSPLTRGKHVFSLEVHTSIGLIPAHAGKTQSSSAWSRRAWAHPRSRGENKLAEADPGKFLGSSPLTRGKPLTAIVPRGTTGLIPAHAGKTAPNGIKNFADGAHPRSRGENSIVVGMVREGMGSSPLTRGKHVKDHAGQGLGGLIPAHAGKTVWAPTVPGWRWAHPRSRGENLTTKMLLRARSGSSPLTRGKRPKANRLANDLGLIPAHAGKTQETAHVLASDWAHPRSRGENSLPHHFRHPHPGSSPLTRGKLPTSPFQTPSPRLIPAHAGKTRSINKS